MHERQSDRSTLFNSRESKQWIWPRFAWDQTGVIERVSWTFVCIKAAHNSLIVDIKGFVNRLQRCRLRPSVERRPWVGLFWYELWVENKPPTFTRVVYNNSSVILLPTYKLKHSWNAKYAEVEQIYKIYVSS